MSYSRIKNVTNSKLPSEAGIYFLCPWSGISLVSLNNGGEEQKKTGFPNREDAAFESDALAKGRACIFAIKFVQV